MKKKNPTKILIVDDQDHYGDLCRRYLSQYDYLSAEGTRKSGSGGHAHNWREVTEIMKRHKNEVDLLLLDVHFDIPEEELLVPAGMSLPKRNGRKAVVEALRRRQGVEILRAFRKRYGNVAAIIMTAREDFALEEEAESLLAEGYTFFLSDEYLDVRTLDSEIRRVMALQRQAPQAEGKIMWGGSPAVQEVRRTLEVLARGGLPILLQGETGSGKSLVAREYIYPLSGRKGAFVTIDISGLPTELVSAHLFGVTKGAFTGAVANRDGVFQKASGGILFIDEIGNIDLAVQKQLLLVLERGVVTPLGSVEEVPVDVSLVVASNQDLLEAVEAGTFRRDLYMRLCPATKVVLPPLRKRQGDIKHFIRYFVRESAKGGYLSTLLERYCSRRDILFDAISSDVSVHFGSVPKGVSQTLPAFFLDRKTIRLFEQYFWPGNVRELEMVTRNAIAFTLVQLEEEQDIDPTDPRRIIIPVGHRTVHSLLDIEGKSGAQCDVSNAHSTVSVSVEAGESLNEVGREVEKQYLLHFYKQCSGDFSRIAEMLLGDSTAGRKVLLRFNQLGLRVRDLR